MKAAAGHDGCQRHDAPWGCARRCSHSQDELDDTRARSHWTHRMDSHELTPELARRMAFTAVTADIEYWRTPQMAL